MVAVNTTAFQEGAQLGVFYQDCLWLAQQIEDRYGFMVDEINLNRNANGCIIAAVFEGKRRVLWRSWESEAMLSWERQTRKNMINHIDWQRLQQMLGRLRAAELV